MNKKNILKKGDKIGRLKLLKNLGVKQINKTRARMWLCECSCGNVVEKRDNNLKNKNVKSCGCLLKEVNHLVKSGMLKGFHKSKKPFPKIYNTWKGILYRCLNKKSNSYKNYGGRGIKVCKRWLKFENFYKDMNDSMEAHIKKYGKSNTKIDRIDNNKDYKPSNCKWSTNKEQCRNTRNSVFIKYKGETKHLYEWADYFKINRSTLRSRYLRKKELFPKE